MHYGRRSVTRRRTIPLACAASSPNPVPHQPLILVTNVAQSFKHYTQNLIKLTHSNENMWGSMLGSYPYRPPLSPPSLPDFPPSLVDVGRDTNGTFYFPQNP
ncbi:hypothetical protein K443DRAFT_597848 [Laccaria amethystina LaAM-08-1]|uniref:Uncharacterized protein n=1 Tax=Laccaria amethystina LaAM-08-1 TaxID=1095629 RepID=A0A0C9XSI1_9AGAR|nr:hypothetical protein K443DRAFT_597848 [Laccaria amethystina LaAM-08-1]